MTDPSVAAARAKAEAARLRFHATLEEIRSRLDPKLLAREVWDDVRQRGTDLAEDAIDVARARPRTAAAVASAAAVVIARRQIWRLLRGLFSRREETAAGDCRLNDQTSPASAIYAPAPGQQGETA